MLLRLSSRSLRLTAPGSLRTSALFSSTSASVSVSSETTAIQEAESPESRERRKKERAEKQGAPAIGIEGTTEFYTRQLVVVDPESSAPLNWPKKLEFSDHVVSSYVKAIASVEHPKHSALKTIAATPFPAPCASEASASSNEDVTQRKHDLLIFPDHVRVQDIEPSHIPSLVTQLLEPQANVLTILDSLKLSYKTLDEGHHILVCAHESRDFRCGCNGPNLLRWLEDVGKKKNVPLHLYSSSHFGGHRYAANCITYPTGDWFGMLNEEVDADALVDTLVDEQPLRLQDKWRGRIGLKKDEQIKLLQEAVQTA